MFNVLNLLFLGYCLFYIVVSVYFGSMFNNIGLISVLIDSNQRRKYEYLSKQFHLVVHTLKPKILYYMNKLKLV